MVSWRSLAYLLTLGTEAFALGAPQDVVCATQLGPVSVANVPRTTLREVEKITVTKRVIRKVNIIIIPIARVTKTLTTVKKVTTTSTADPDTDVVTETVYDTTWVTSPIEVIETAFSTSTTYNTIWTPVIIPTSPGFVPIQSDPKFVPKLKARVPKVQQQENRIVVGAPDSPQPMNPPQYPQRVDCTSKVRSTSTNVVRVTVDGLRLTLFAVTRIQWSTSTSTIMSMEYPDRVTEIVTKRVPTTETKYTNHVITTTIIESSMEEVTLPLPGGTSYAACQSNNFIFQANRQMGIRSYNIWGAWADDMGEGYDMEACCIECAKRPDCMGSSYTWFGASCTLWMSTTPATCQAGTPATFGSYNTGWGKSWI
ncbi:hypothetical protein CEP51_013904 [Fusarium floridanum]|uniref:Apple domain-containing protein n=1 Tax=Fusarium floridanum TaxID=1325733 RepID=A0A428Q2P8_9HYPO|nr:hypothetical protein CEP51_013904 [Fusarium floridanum]